MVTQQAPAGRGSGGGEWKPGPRQAVFLARTEDEVMYGGAKMGGKTDVLLLWTILRRVKYPNSRGLFVRRQVAELTRQGAAWARAHELLGGGVVYNETHHTIKFPNGSILEFNHCKDDASLSHYQGAQYDDICFDQLEQFTEKQYLYISAACRVPQGDPPHDADGNPILPRIRASANPGDIGHAWVKRRFVDVAGAEKTYKYEVKIARDVGQDPLIVSKSRAFIPSRLFDNPYASPEYAATLYALPEPYRSAFLYGKWDVFVGQAFPDFHPITETGDPYHVIPQMDIPRHWIKVGGHDWGYAGMCYTCWGAIDPDGGIIIYKELAVKRWTPDEIARGVLTLQGSDKVLMYWCGSDVWNSSRANMTLSMIEALEEAGELHLSKAEQYRAAGWSSIQRAQNGRDRLAGKMRIHTMMQERPGPGFGRDPEGTPYKYPMPYLRIMDNCSVLIETLQLIQGDPKRVEDVETDYPEDAAIRDDPYDALRYMLMSLNIELTGETEEVPEAVADWRA
jgi:hypothetical protein